MHSARGIWQLPGRRHNASYNEQFGHDIVKLLSCQETSTVHTHTHTRDTIVHIYTHTYCIIIYYTYWATVMQMCVHMCIYMYTYIASLRSILNSTYRMAGRYFGGLLKICHLAEFTLVVEPVLAIMIFITKWLIKCSGNLTGP